MAALVQDDDMAIHNDSSSNVSQPTTTDASNTQISPSTSASSLFQHEQIVESNSSVPKSPQRVAYPSLDVEAIEGLRALSQSNGSTSSASSHRAYSPAESTGTYHAGHKRTATGEVKSPVLGGPLTPRRGHSRHSSILSNGSTVAELSQQLRTRLSYAMVKVQNGWQSNTIEEVETLASQQGSPVSSKGNGFSRHSWQSPRAEIAARKHRRWSKSGPLDVTTQDQAVPQVLSSQRSLAPAADIHQSQIKRQQQQPSQPISNPKAAPGSLGLAIPSTPPRRQAQHPFKQRTPSQNAAMEADAIETLLFMSSPGNSGYHSQSTINGSQTSPLRSHFAPSDLTPRAGHSRQDYGSSMTGRVPKRDQDLDRVLDEMSSEGSVNGDEGTFLQNSGLGSLGTVHS